MARRGRFRMQNRREQRQREAKLRQEASDKLTPQERITRLDNLFGVGLGATKERAKLQARIQRAAGEALMKATPQELGEAAVKAAQKEPARNDRKARKARARRDAQAVDAPKPTSE